MSHIKKKIGIYSFCILASSVVSAEGSSVVYATKVKTPENNLSVNVSESNVSETVKYIDGKGQRSLDPKSEKDMEELAIALNLKYINLTKRRHQKQRFFHPQGFVVVLKVMMA